MDTVVKSPVMLFTEETPNPEALKYVTNRLLYRGVAEFREKELAAEWSPFANSLMELPYVKNVHINNNFVTILKEFNYEWSDVMLTLKAFIKDYLEKDGAIIREGFAEFMEAQVAASNEAQFSGEDGDIARRVKELIDMYVKPAVEGDGGNIEFKAYDKGTVHVIMQGSCSGCPSSTVTLKSGIEGMLKRMIPEVKEVVQEMA